MSTFGNTKPFSTGFGGSIGTNSQTQPTPSTFGQPSQNSTPNTFSSFSFNNQAQKPAFGASTPAPFGQTTSQSKQQNTEFYPQNAQQPQQQPQQQASGAFGQQSTFGQSQQQSGQGQTQQQQPQQSYPLRQTLRFGQSTTASQDMSQSPIWQEGKGMGIYRPVSDQMIIIRDKWDFENNTASPLRQYLYNNEDKEEEVVMYQPRPDEDSAKWEQAVDKRPTPTSVPAIVRGFVELGCRAQIQRQGTANCEERIHQINGSLDVQLQRHSQAFAPRIAECRRRHTVTRQRTLALAAKIQILRNRGYVMDNAEEELKEKLLKLEREVFDPSLSGREQEIWARMLGIRERGKRLRAEMEKVIPVANGDEPVLDEGTVQAAKKALDAYDTQLRHLQKELQLIQQEFEDWEKAANGELDLGR